MCFILLLQKSQIAWQCAPKTDRTSSYGIFVDDNRVLFGSEDGYGKNIIVILSLVQNLGNKYTMYPLICEAWICMLIHVIILTGHGSSSVGALKHMLCTGQIM